GGDTRRGHIRARKKGAPGESYITAGPAATFEDALKLAEQITGVPVPRLRLAPGVLKAMSGLMSVVERVTPVPEDYSAENLRINAGVTYIGDNTKARRELGYSPRSLKAGLAETLYHKMRFLSMPVPPSGCTTHKDTRSVCGWKDVPSTILHLHQDRFKLPGAIWSPKSNSERGSWLFEPLGFVFLWLCCQ